MDFTNLEFAVSPLETALNIDLPSVEIQDLVCTHLLPRCEEMGSSLSVVPRPGFTASQEQPSTGAGRRPT